MIENWIIFQIDIISIDNNITQWIINSIKIEKFNFSYNFKCLCVRVFNSVWI